MFSLQCILIAIFQEGGVAFSGTTTSIHSWPSLLPQNKIQNFERKKKKENS